MDLVDNQHPRLDATQDAQNLKLLLRDTAEITPRFKFTAA
jgi:hypothetical protein